MNEWLSQNREIYGLFSGNGLAVSTVFMLMLFLTYKSKNAILKKYFIYPSLVVLLFITNPISLKLFVDTALLLESRYVRLYWLLPVAAVVAYLCAAAVKRGEGKKRMEVVALLLVVCIMISGNYMFSSANFQKAENIYKLPKGVIEVTEAIREDALKDEKQMSDVKAAVPGTLSPYIRQYDGEIKMLYGRNIESDPVSNMVQTQMKKSELNIQVITSYARKGECQYLVLEADKKQDDKMDKFGYQLVKEEKGYLIYKDMLTDGTWMITEYASVTGNQSMFYTIVSEDGKLIIVDGGWDMDEELVRSVVASHGNTVDVWIGSHFHGDHIGALTKILANPSGITINEVWRPEMDESTYSSFAQYWDSVELCNEFLALTDGMDNVKKLNAGDELEIDNLKIKVFSAFDKEKEYTYDGNNCGLVFKVSGNTESMLFCCDGGGGTIVADIKNTYGEQVKADYIQMGHHGNGGFPKEFYELVNPKVAFFDAPDALFNDTTGQYTSRDNRKIMEDIGCKIYSFKTAPNTIFLK